MCRLLKLHYAKFDVSSLFYSKAIEEKTLGDQLDPSLGKKGLISNAFIYDCLKLTKVW